MKIAEILRAFADLIDAAESNQPISGDSINNQPSVNNDHELDPSPVMVPPLQQKIELDKRAVDVDNHFSDKEAEESDNDSNDELIQMKKIAGLLGHRTQ